MEKLPSKKRMEIIAEEERENRKEILETKKSLWKLRKKEKSKRNYKT